MIRKLFGVVVLSLCAGLVSAIMQSALKVENPDAYVLLGMILGILLTKTKAWRES